MIAAHAKAAAVVIEALAAAAATAAHAAAAEAATADPDANQPESFSRTARGARPTTQRNRKGEAIHASPFYFQTHFPSPGTPGEGRVRVNTQNVIHCLRPRTPSGPSPFV